MQFQTLQFIIPPFTNQEYKYLYFSKANSLSFENDKQKSTIWFSQTKYETLLRNYTKLAFNENSLLIILKDKTVSALVPTPSKNNGYNNEC